MRRITTGLLLSVFLLSPWAMAQNTDERHSTSSTTTEEVGGYLRNEVLSVKPQVGAILFTDQTGTDRSRLAGGLQIDLNTTSMAVAGPTNFYFGPSFGAIYSHIGDAGADFVGSNNLNGGAASANMLVIPANLKMGYNFGDAMRLSAHGGGNVIYRSIVSSVQLGIDNPTTGTLWRVYPNVGADMEFAFGRSVALGLRPDVTLTPGSDMYTGTVTLGIALG